MNENKFLINHKFDDAVTIYINLYKNDNLEKNDNLLVNIIRCLIFIYGDVDLINPHITKDNKTLISNMTKYGLSSSEALEFINYISNEVNINKIFISEQLINMFVMKNRFMNINEFEKSSFLNFINLKILGGVFDSYIIFDQFEKTASTDYKEIVVENEIEFLDIQPEFSTQNNKKTDEMFRVSFANGYISVMTILITILLVCTGIILVNFLVG